ncbi:cellulose biosynthesis protein BcsG, partial [Burkholderia pseudomallei]|uniref:cellulose biosynthesis protein BcsG n=1 Tax=Burkholderia pseudomallei TaxID=28450 RepID=UPI00113178FD
VYDGHFDNFLQLIREKLGVPSAATIPNADALVAMHAFDGSSIKGDYATLANRYAKRGARPRPVAPAGNTISLHDGNQLTGGRMSSLD